jgi:hypothetical protein
VDEIELADDIARIAATLGYFGFSDATVGDAVDDMAAWWASRC